MSGHRPTFRTPKRKGVEPCGYRPLTGMPRDEHGGLILEWVYPEAKPARKNLEPQGSLL